MPAEAYSNVAALFNLPSELAYPAPRWPLDRRKDMLREKNQNYGAGRTLPRRDAAELNVRDVSHWLTALLHERPVELRVKRQRLVGARGLYTRLGQCQPGMLDLRGKIRAGISWLVEHGPASGWALANRKFVTESTSNFTPWYIPRRSLHVAERWVRVALFVNRLVRLFAALATRLIPAPRSAATEPPTEKKQDSVPAVNGRQVRGTGISPPPERGGPPTALGDILDRLRRKYGDGGHDDR